MVSLEQSHIRLIEAIERDDLEDCYRILAEHPHGGLGRPVGPLQITALHLAAWHERIDMLERLEERGADVNTSDKIGRSALYYAAHRGNARIVKWLLERGAFLESRVGIYSCTKDSYAASLADSHLVGRNLPLPECWNRTPLHEAVNNNRPSVVRILVDAGANVNVKDERGVTPLLLAGANVEKGDHKEVSKFDEIVQILVSAKASVNVMHSETGSTVLHHATILGSSKAVKILMENGACATIQCLTDGSTPLHIAASSGNLKILSILVLEVPCEYLDVRDQKAFSPLHQACYHGFRGCARELINRGCSLAAKAKNGITAMDILFAHLPRPLPFLTEILDCRVRMIDTSTSQSTETYISVDFSVLAPKGDLQMGVITSLIGAASDTRQLSLLQHPIVESYLHLKWTNLRIFFFLLVLVHVAFVLSLSAYAVTILESDAECTVPRRILAPCSFFLLVHDIVQVLMLPRHYLKQLETWLIFICAAISFVISVAGEYDARNAVRAMEGSLTAENLYPSQWVLHSVSLAILLGWTQMMLLAGRFPMWGYYALMFATVLKNILKVLLAFVCLIVGFALSFAVLFHGNDQFRDSWRAIVKTVVMMMGEYEYGDLFSVEGNIGNEGNKSSYLPVTSRIVFLVFVMLTSIVLMNLMIGLAVSDIQGLEKEGHIRRLLKQAEFVAHLERLISHRAFRSNWLHPRLRKLFVSRRGISTKITMSYNENYFHDSSHGIPNRLKEALYVLARRNYYENDSSTCDSKLNEDNMDVASMLLHMEQEFHQLRRIYYPSLLDRKHSKPYALPKSMRRRKSIVS